MPESVDTTRRTATDWLALASVGSIASFVTVLCVVAARFPGAREMVTAVIVGLGAGGLILFRQLRRAAGDMAAREARAQYNATHDDLTQLPNKSLFLERLGIVAKAVGDDEAETRTAVFCVGLDRFEEVIEVLGISASDAIVVEAVARLGSLCREEDTLARLGDEAFALMRSDFTRDTAQSFAEELVRRMGEPYAAAAGQVLVTASVGIAFLQHDLAQPVEALRQAQMALSSARKLGDASHRIFQPAMDRALKNRKTLEVELRSALEAGDLTLAYQPQVNAKGVMVGVEALTRWTSQARGAIPPSTFIPLSESCGLSDAIGRFALRQAFLDARRWPNIRVAINVTAPHIRSGGLVNTLKDLIEETGSNPHRFELEITESVLLDDEPDTFDTLNAIRRLGLSIALDDFGTGYSSLSYLRRFPVDKIKIDRAFVAQLGKRPESSAIIKAMVELAEALELKVIAEGVESEDQVARLAQVGCSLYQGFLYSPPVDADTITAMAAGKARRVA